VLVGAHDHRADGVALEVEREAEGVAGELSISPCIASDSPWMRQMPSVTETIVPWVRTSAPSARLWILLLMRSLISEGLSCCIVNS
jgi:hypothetical protein